MSSSSIIQERIFTLGFIIAAFLTQRTSRFFEFPTTVFVVSFHIQIQVLAFTLINAIKTMLPNLFSPQRVLAITSLTFIYSCCAVLSSSFEEIKYTAIVLQYLISALYFTCLAATLYNLYAKWRDSRTPLFPWISSLDYPFQISLIQLGSIVFGVVFLCVLLPSISIKYGMTSYAIAIYEIYSSVLVCVLLCACFASYHLYRIKTDGIKCNMNENKAFVQ
jgi:hypothetical protein